MTKSINVPEASAVVKTMADKGFGANQWNSFGGRNKIVVAYFAEAATKARPAGFR